MLPRIGNTVNSSSRNLQGPSYSQSTKSQAVRGASLNPVSSTHEVGVIHHHTQENPDDNYEQDMFEYEEKQ